MQFNGKIIKTSFNLFMKIFMCIYIFKTQKHNYSIRHASFPSLALSIVSLTQLST